jgi:hypothetical protein
LKKILKKNQKKLRKKLKKQRKNLRSQGLKVKMLIDERSCARSKLECY